MKPCMLLAVLWLCCGPVQAATMELLVFSKTGGWRHDSIPDGQAALRALADGEGWSLHFSEDAGLFDDAGLAAFDAVVFLNTTGEVLDDAQQAAFERYIRSGGAYVGVHSASDTEHDWPWYGRLVGAWFDRHGKIQPGRLDVLDREHPSTRHLPAQWRRSDEWYDFKSLPQGVQVLLELDGNSVEDSRMRGAHPLAWYHEFEGGRAWYTALGHTRDSYRDPAFLAHLAGGIRWAAGAPTGP